jgi:alpha,alpha-trehalase
MKHFTVTLLALLALASPVHADEQLASPAKLYGELFQQVQMQKIFADGKTFVDMVPLQPPAAIAEEYRRVRSSPGFDLAEFVAGHFADSSTSAAEYQSDPRQDVREHIDALWPVLTRGPDPSSRYSSLLPLPNSYIVPGGRFKEVY